MYCDLWPYVWLVFKSGFKSRAGYSGARTVYKNNLDNESNKQKSDQKKPSGSVIDKFKVFLIFKKKFALTNRTNQNKKKIDGQSFTNVVVTQVF